MEPVKHCKNCNLEFYHARKQYCSQTCYIEYRSTNKMSKEEYNIKACIKKGDKKFKDKIEGYDYLVCQECGAKTGELFNHIKLHSMTTDDYKSKFNVHKLYTEKKSQSIKGENNPAYQHGGKFSPFSKEFVNGYDKEWHEKHIENHKKNMQENKHLFHINIEYWLIQTDGDEELAKELHTKSQTRDLDHFINKYGEEIGAQKHNEKIKKWMTSFKKCNYSMISQELFNELVPYVNKEYLYYATFERDDMTHYVNKEYILPTGNRYIRPDFIDLSIKKVIEFDGDYWHSEQVANPEREKNRDKLLLEAGYQVLHIAENRYINDKQGVIEECIKFLTS